MKRKSLFLLMCAISLNAFTQSEKYLSMISKYNESSVFEDERYVEMTWQKFYQLDEANELVDPMNYDFDLLNAACVSALNKYRTANHIPVLHFNPSLRDAASIQTDQMVRLNYFDHFNPKSKEIRSPSDRDELCGYSGEKIAENIARSWEDIQKPLTYIQLAEKAVKELSVSREHNEHMLDKSYNEIGCAIIFEKTMKQNFAYFRFTQSFGKRWEN